MKIIRQDINQDIQIAMYKTIGVIIVVLVPLIVLRLLKVVFEEHTIKRSTSTFLPKTPDYYIRIDINILA